MSGELLREMIERAGSGCTIVASGGSSSSRLPQPSSTASARVDSKRPSGFDTPPPAPRPVGTVGRVGEVMDWMLLDIKPVCQSSSNAHQDSELGTGAAAAGESW